MLTQDRRAELRALLETQDGLRRLREWIAPAVRRVLGTDQDIDDVQEETLLQLWRECHRARDVTPRQQINDLEAWVVGVARHLALDWLQKRVRRRQVEGRVESDDNHARVAESFDPERSLVAEEVHGNDQYDEVAYRQRLIEVSYKDLRRITVERGLRGGINPEEIAKRLGTNRNHIYQLAFRLRADLAHRAAPSTDPERVGRAIDQIVARGGPDAHHLAHITIRRLVSGNCEAEATEQLAVVASPAAMESEICTNSDVTTQTVAAALTREGVRLAEIFWFLDDGTRLPLCEKLARYVYGEILKPLVALVIASASPCLMEFVLRSTNHVHASADQIRPFLLHLNLTDMAARVDRRLMVRASVLYMAEWLGDGVDFLDLHDPAWLRDYLLSLINGHRRIPHHMEAERWIAISVLGRHLASSRLGVEDLEKITADAERPQSIAQLATAFVVNDADHNWDKAKAVFVRGWSGGLVYQPFVLKAPFLGRDSKALCPIQELLPALMACLEDDSPLAMLAGIRELMTLTPSSLNADFASAAIPRIRALSRVVPELPLIEQAENLCDRLLNGPPRRRTGRKM